MKKLKTYFLIALTLLLTNCNLFGDDNDQEQLPEATQIGANTFGYKVNGEIVNVTNTSKQTAIYQGGILQLGGGGGKK